MKFRICSFKDWGGYITFSLEKDFDFYDDFQLSINITKKAECRSITNGILKRTKLIVFEIFNMRLIEFKLVKVKDIK